MRKGLKRPIRFSNSQYIDSLIMNYKYVLPIYCPNLAVQKIMYFQLLMEPFAIKCIPIYRSNLSASEHLKTLRLNFCRSTVLLFAFSFSFSSLVRMLGSDELRKNQIFVYDVGSFIHSSLIFKPIQSLLDQLDYGLLLVLYYSISRLPSISFKLFFSPVNIFISLLCINFNLLRYYISFCKKRPKDIEAKSILNDDHS
jgi:hypothetical protein